MLVYVGAAVRLEYARVRACAFREQAEEEESDKAHTSRVCVVLPGRSRVSTPKPAACSIVVRDRVRI